MEPYIPNRKFVNAGEASELMSKSVEKENGFNQNYSISRTNYEQLELNYGKLLKFLKEFGHFPNKHRAEIWSFLLNLPHNEGEFEVLEGMGAHELYKEVDSKLEPK